MIKFDVFFLSSTDGTDPILYRIWIWLKYETFFFWSSQFCLLSNQCYYFFLDQFMRKRHVVVYVYPTIRNETLKIKFSSKNSGKNNTKKKKILIGHKFNYRYVINNEHAIFTMQTIHTFTLHRLQIYLKY